MTRYRVVHESVYEHEESVGQCYNEAHLSPRDQLGQLCEESSIEVDPTPSYVSERRDYFGNRVVHFQIHEPFTRLTVLASSTVTVDASAFDNETESPRWEEVRDALAAASDPDTVSARQYCLESPIVPDVPEMLEFARGSFSTDRPLLEAASDLSSRIHSEFVFDPSSTTTATPLRSVMKKRRGVCQDFTHVAIGCLRACGLAARYVSGYVETIPPPGQERLTGADVSHAWFSVFCPGRGWVDFDPTNDRPRGEQHITTAWGRDYSDVTPLKGVIYGGGKHTLEVSVDVARVES